jgi:phenol/toluene 2-monooxygenase (NADH) P0/A0
MTAISPRVFDPRRRFVRIVDERTDGMVEFEFAVGEPELFVEMILPREAFEDFCAREQVQPTRGDAVPSRADARADDGSHWTLHDARAHRLARGSPTDDEAPGA